MVGKKDATLQIKGATHLVDSVSPEQMNEWTQECLGRFPLGKRFNVLLCDIPWRHRSGDYTKSRGRQGMCTYPTMCLADVKALPVPQILDDSAAVLMWTTGSMLCDSMKVIESWGLTYVTMFLVWQKTYANGDPAVGTGSWTRPSTEFILLARRGTGLTKLRTSRSVRQVVRAPLLGHSHKPLIFKEIIKEFFRTDRRIELFARETTPGWSSWGLEVNTEEGDHFFHLDQDHPVV